MAAAARTPALSPLGGADELGAAAFVPWCRIRYHMVVSNAKKILAGMRRNARNWRMEDLEVVARRFGVDVDSQGGTSHVTFRHPRAGRTTVPKHIPIKPW